MDKKMIRKRTEEVIKRNAIVTELNDFLATHVPFKELKYCPSGTSDFISKKYSEENLFNDFILENQEKHNFIIVQGNNGSGKSHFIRWLKYKYDNEFRDCDEVSILIERNHNTLQGTIEQLLNNKVIKEFVGEEQLNKLANAGESITTEKFLTTIALSFATEVMHEDDEECILTKRVRKKLSEFLLNQTVITELLTCENGPIERIGNKIISNENRINLSDNSMFCESDFKIELDSDFIINLNNEGAAKKVISFAEDLAENEFNLRTKVTKYLNSKINNIIQNAIKLSSKDLDNMIVKIRKELKKVNKNLTIFIEDITSFTGVDRAIIENLIVEHTSENNLCRLFSVVGITNGYYKDHFPENLKDRVTGRIIIDEESIFGNEKAIMDIASRYINAIYLDVKIISEWIKNGALENELPISKVVKEWATYEDYLNRKFNIYPLTERAIINLYNELEVKTPRNFTNMILAPIFNHFSDSDNEFPQGISELSGSLKIPEFNSLLMNQKIDEQFTGEIRDRVKSFLRIWGDGTLDTVNENNIVFVSGISQDIFSEFNIPLVNGNYVERKTNTKNNAVALNKNKQQMVTINKEPDVEETIKEDNEPKLRKPPREYDIIRKDIIEWKEKNQELKNHSKIRDYIIEFLKEAINWEMEGVTSYLVAETLNRNNFVIEGQLMKGMASSTAYEIAKTDENYYFILALIDYNMLGNKRWKYTDATDGIRTVSKWVYRNKEEIIKYVKAIDEAKFDPYNYALVNQYYILELTSKEAMYSNVEDLYFKLLKKDMQLDIEKLKLILGERYNEIIKEKDSLDSNHTFVKRYYNCKLGDANINTTPTFFLDAKEILERVERLHSKAFKLDSNIKIAELANLQERRKESYSLYKRIFDTKLPHIINEIFDNINETKDKFINLIGDADIKELTTEIDKFYSRLSNANIYYKNDLKNSFNELFVEKYIGDKLVKLINDSNSKHISVKINCLKMNPKTRLERYYKTLKSIDELVTDTLARKKQFNTYKDLEEQLGKKKAELYTKFENAENALIEVNGGVDDANK